MRRTTSWARAALLLCLIVALFAQPATAREVAGAERWVGTWATAPTAPGTDPLPSMVFEDQTLRQIVHTSRRGSRVRIRLSNEFGDRPLMIGEAHVARVAGEDGEIEPASDRQLTFSGRASVTVPARAPMLSDPVALDVPARSDLAVSVHLPQRTPATTVHGSAFQENYVAAGNVTGAATIAPTATVTSWYFLTGVRVAAPRSAGSVVTLGDSITDGAVTTPGTNRRWPDQLARRFGAEPGLAGLGVVNVGIGGNRILHDGSPIQPFGPLFGPSALARFDRDVLSQPSARYLTVLLGINDIGHPSSGTAPASEDVSVDDLIAGHRQLIERAHEHGLEVFGATLTPFEGTVFPGYFTEAGEAKRQVVNEWIRTSGEYDGVIDFDQAVRDPENPRRMLPAYDSGDHLHPNDAGMAAMAQAVPLRLFRAPEHAGRQSRREGARRPAAARRGGGGSAARAR
jgi:lysophospholipase L1-like esterase